MFRTRKGHARCRILSSVLAAGVCTLAASDSKAQIVRLHQHCNFGGWTANFTILGNFNTSAIVSRGGVNNDASSIRVAPGFKVTLFSGNNQTGRSLVLRGDDSCFVDDGFNDVLSSLRIEAEDPGDVDNTIRDCGFAPDAGVSGNVHYVQVHSKRSIPIKVCVAERFWNGSAAARADIPKFFDYFDLLVPELQTLFSFKPTPQPAGAPFVIQIKSPFGGASTGIDGGLGSDIGVTITGDAYSNTFNSSLTGKSVKGFWGYLLTIHELVNVWTGEMTSGWPTDWWADHRSPFPNAMDEVVMRDIGTKTANQTLLDAATVQHARFTDPGSGDADPEVGMFLNFFDRFGGFTPYNRAFSLVRGDGLHWDDVSPSNPSPLRTEYVIAYLQMGLRTTADLTESDFVAAGVSGGTDQDLPYSISAATVGDIADAHCSIASARNSGRSVSAALAALRQGDFTSATLTAGCGAPCPGECGCDTAANQCVARWRAR